MATVSSRYYSNALGGFVSFTAIVPFEDHGSNFLAPNPEPYELKKPLRTIYLLHGICGNEHDWLYGSRIEEYAVKNKIAVIMPDGNNNFYVDNSPTERWGEFVGKEIVEVTRNLFPLSREREDTFIGGFSMGGYGAIRNGLKYSETFSKIVSLSGSIMSYAIPEAFEEADIPWRKKSFYERIFGSLDDVVGSEFDPEYLFLQKKKEVSIYMAIGVDDFLLEQNRRFKKFLEKNHATLYYLEEPGTHNWDFWDAHIKKALEWI
ncbi:MAG: alpha/beta hydrolase [Lachnospiraceae bacterium]